MWARRGEQAEVRSHRRRTYQAVLLRGRISTFSGTGFYTRGTFRNLFWSQMTVSSCLVLLCQGFYFRLLIPPEVPLLVPGGRPLYLLWIGHCHDPRESSFRGLADPAVWASQEPVDYSV